MANSSTHGKAHQSHAITGLAVQEFDVLAKTPDAVHIGADHLMLDAANHYAPDILAAVGLRDDPGIEGVDRLAGRHH
jgi:hypothetical protein